MMMKCPSCGQKISQNAKTCPHCQRPVEPPRKIETKPCRSCGTPLVVKDHREIVYKSDPTILDRSPVSTYTKHTPCPKCGDPRPLDDVYPPSVAGNRKPLLIAVLVAAALAAAAFAWFMLR